MQSRHPVQNFLDNGSERGVGSALGELLDEVTALLQAPGELGVQGNRACNSKGQGRADRGLSGESAVAESDNLRSVSGTYWPPHPKLSPGFPMFPVASAKTPSPRNKNKRRPSKAQQVRSVNHHTLTRNSGC